MYSGGLWNAGKRWRNPCSSDNVDSFCYDRFCSFALCQIYYSTVRQEFTHHLSEGVPEHVCIIPNLDCLKGATSPNVPLSFGNNWFWWDVTVWIEIAKIDPDKTITGVDIFTSGRCYLSRIWIGQVGDMNQGLYSLTESWQMALKRGFI